MQIIIPMSGFGERFRKKGYAVPKPLIEIDGKPIIAHVIDMFPGETDFIFICNKDHLLVPEYQMKNILKKYSPFCRIIGIAPHKLGPVHAVLQAIDFIDAHQPTIVNYCDFTCYWCWDHFKEFVKATKCVGAIPAYKGFHPHTLGSTNYAYIREKSGYILDIQEKQPYTDNRMEEFASSGTYYFSSGKIMLDAFKDVVKQNLMVKGEFYVSLAYKSILAEKKSVIVYQLQHFMQWGTPQDVEEYNTWAKIFRRLLIEKNDGQILTGSVIIPMAGLGIRFANEGYSKTKPLIPVSGKPMVLQAVNSLPKVENYIFVLRDDMNGCEKITSLLNKSFENIHIKKLSNVTNGQASTALIGLKTLLSKVGNIKGPITFGACDFGALYSHERFQEILDDSTNDVIVWGVRGSASSQINPQMFGWIDEVDGDIKNISVKTPLKKPETDPIVLGTFTFRKPEVFFAAIERMYERNGKVNGEYYLDSMINDVISLGYKCKFFEVDSYLSWGTPNDLRTFEYWQSCFHKWKGHPYKLANDNMIHRSYLEAIEDSCFSFSPSSIKI